MQMTRARAGLIALVFAFALAALALAGQGTAWAEEVAAGGDAGWQEQSQTQRPQGEASVGEGAVAGTEVPGEGGPVEGDLADGDVAGGDLAGGDVSDAGQPADGATDEGLSGGATGDPAADAGGQGATADPEGSDAPAGPGTPAEPGDGSGELGADAAAPDADSSADGSAGEAQGDPGAQVGDGVGDMQVEAEAVAADATQVEGAQGADQAVTPAVGVGFVYIDEAAPVLGSVQNVAIILDDEAVALASAQLSYVDGYGNALSCDATALAGNAALFQISVDVSGTYQLTSVSYTSQAAPEAAPASIDLTAASAEACAFEVADQSVAPLALFAEPQAIPGEASFYALGADGELQQVSSLGDAVAASPQATSALARVGGADGEGDLGYDPSETFVIALDPGHGGFDSGATGYGLLEKDLTWAITMYCKEALEQYPGVTVVLTREEDECPTIRQRVENAVAAGARVIVSIHINSDETGTSYGAEVWFPNDSSWRYDQTHVPGSVLSQNILDKLVALGLTDRGIKVRTLFDDPDYGPYEDGSNSDYYGITRYAREHGIVGIIVEHAFISNESDAALLSSEAMLRQMGYADAEGIAQTYGLGQESPALFGDTLPGDWYMTEGWIPYVVEHGLMTGVQDPDGVARNFFPNDSLTRGQLATILYRAAFPNSTQTTVPEDFAVSNSFDDTPTDPVTGDMIPYYYNAAIRWCRDTGIITGYTSGPDAGCFLPDNPVTREDLATMVCRFAEVMGVDTASADATAFYSTADYYDVQDYAVAAMIWCADQGIINGNKHGVDGPLTLEPQAGATRAQAAKVVTVLFRDVLGM